VEFTIADDIQPGFDLARDNSRYFGFGDGVDLVETAVTFLGLNRYMTVRVGGAIGGHKAIRPFQAADYLGSGNGFGCVVDFSAPGAPMGP
jgi:hypothetical protein